jgi:hypothetical protein
MAHGRGTWRTTASCWHGSTGPLIKGLVQPWFWRRWYPTELFWILGKRCSYRLTKATGSSSKTTYKLSCDTTTDRLSVSNPAVYKRIAWPKHNHWICCGDVHQWRSWVINLRHEVAYEFSRAIKIHHSAHSSCIRSILTLVSDFQEIQLLPQLLDGCLEAFRQQFTIALTSWWYQAAKNMVEFTETLFQS